jgi:exosome complex RNA-binding protein Rrp42 (RNase PH superfamily)
MFKKIANTEKEYITSGCQYEVRSDGRENKNIRPISAEYNIFPHTNGSSRIRIGNSTDVTCSVRVEVIDLNLKLHDQGQMEVNIDISPCCHIGLDDRRISENTQIIANQLQRS